MSRSEGTGRALEDPAERAVVEYLQRHPEFFVRNAYLLERLNVPHDCGKAVSLIEHQVGVLKDQCRGLRQHLRELVENARANEELARRLHRLILALIESPALDEIFTTLYQALEEGFGADVVSLRVFAEAVSEQDRGLGELVGPGHPARDRFAALFEDLKPVCGRLKAEHLEFFLAERATQVRSAALIPFVAGQRRGVLLIGSRDPRRFHPSMGTLYIRQLADVVGCLLQSRVS